VVEFSLPDLQRIPCPRRSHYILASRRSILPNTDGVPARCRLLRPTVPDNNDYVYKSPNMHYLNVFQVFYCPLSVQLAGFAINLASDGLTVDSQWSWHLRMMPARVGSDWLANAGPSPRSTSTAKRGSGQPRVDVGRLGGHGVRVAGDVPTEMPVSRSSTCAGRSARILRLPCCRSILAASLAADTDPGAARMRWLGHENLFPSE
jgi:hypothetical protein